MRWLLSWFRRKRSYTLSEQKQALAQVIEAQPVVTLRWRWREPQWDKFKMRGKASA